MKKWLCFLISFTFFVTPVLAQELNGNIQQSTNVPIPDWSEFCPAKFINAQNKNEASITTEDIMGRLFVASLFGIPIGLPMMWHVKKRKTVQYWYDRRKSFEHSLNYCSNLSNDNFKFNCIQNLRQSEVQKTFEKDRNNAIRSLGY